MKKLTLLLIIISSFITSSTLVVYLAMQLNISVPVFESVYFLTVVFNGMIHAYIFEYLKTSIEIELNLLHKKTQKQPK